MWTEYLVQHMLTAITINLSPVLCEQMHLISLSHLGVWDKIIDLFPQLHRFCLYFCGKKINLITLLFTYHIETTRFDFFFFLAT